MSKGRVLVAMSGGVDSSVSAALLAQQGYEVIGAMMRFWLDDQQGDDCSEGCCSPDAAYEARRVADQIGIPFYLLDYRDTFKENIIGPFIEGYRHGRTPNPCVWCNTRVKFDALLQKARRLGAEYVATGHYARLTDSPQAALFRGGDPYKDQTYFLWGTAKGAIPHIRFPVGHMHKDEVRKLAEQLGLATAKKPESQNICFVQGGLRGFLKEHLDTRSGPLVDLETGEIVGQHAGTALYTVGQRKGLGLFKSHLDRYVVEVRPQTNEVVVGPRGACSWWGLEAREANWLVDRRDLPEEVSVQVRYRQKPVRARIISHRPEKFVLRFTEPLFAVTPGQSAVVYQEDRLLGGGFIHKAQGPAWAPGSSTELS